MQSYEEIFKTQYQDLYSEIAYLVPEIPDQRCFESSLWSNLTPWTIEKIWQTLLEEMEVLLSAPNRGDTNDNNTFELLRDTTGKSVSKILKRADTAFYNILKQFIATYPTLSFALIRFTKCYQLGIMGDHPIIIKEVISQKWRDLANSSVLQEKLDLLGDVESPFGDYPEIFIKYADTENNITNLLNVVNITKNFEMIADDAVRDSNKLALRILCKRLNVVQKQQIMEDIVELDELSSFIDLFVFLDNSMLVNCFITSIYSGSRQILQYIIDNTVINVTFDNTTPELNNRTNVLNIKYDDIHKGLYSSIFSIVSMTPIEILIKIVRISRFDSFGKLDLFCACIQQDGVELKMLIDLGLDMVSNINNSPGVTSSVLLEVLNSGIVNDDIKEFVMSKYKIEKSVLLCTCTKFTKNVAVKYLLKVTEFSTKELYSALSYGNRETNNIIMKKLGMQHDNIKPVGHFELL